MGPYPGVNMLRIHQMTQRALLSCWLNWSRKTPITEAELQDAVIELAHLLGWRVSHFRPARTEQGWRTPVSADGKGWPDLVLVRDRVIYVELKSAKGKCSYEQLQWILWLEAAGQECYVFRPAEWLDGTIETTLRKRTLGFIAVRDHA